MSLVIGLTGPNAAGKGEVASYLGSLGFTVHSLSDVVRAEAAARSLPPERDHLIRIGKLLRREHGPGVLAERILPRLGQRDVVDSVRSPAEVKVLRRVPGFVLVGVRASGRVRFERSVARRRAGDPLNLEAFLDRERQENLEDPGGQQLGAAFRLADRVLDNDGTLDDLHRAIDRLLAECGEGRAAGFDDAARPPLE